MTQRRRRNLVLPLIAFPLAVALCGSAQPPTFSTISELIVLHVGVKDRHGVPIPDLPEQAFAVFEDGRAQTVGFFASVDAPVTIGLLIDNSGSMQPIAPLVLAAASAFAEASNPADEFFALTFDDFVTAALPESAPFTSTPAVLKSALAGKLVPRGLTALFESIASGLRYVQGGRNERRVLVLVSDGGDNASRITFDDVLMRTQASNTLIYTVALLDELDRDRNPKLLRRIAEASGGEMFEPRNERDIGEVLEHIAHDIRTMYTIGYVSTNPARDGSFRRVRVTVQAPGKKAVVHTRAGYLAAGR